MNAQLPTTPMVPGLLAIGFILGVLLGAIWYQDIGRSRQAQDMRQTHCAHLEGTVQGAVCIVDGSVVAWPHGLGVDDDD